MGGNVLNTPPGVSAVLSTAEFYDPVANKMTTVAPMPTARSGVGVAVSGGLVYAIGGYQTVGSINLNTVEVWRAIVENRRIDWRTADV